MITIDELDRFFSILVAVLVTIEYGIFVMAEIRNSLFIERKCRHLVKIMDRYIFGRRTS